MTRTPSPRGLAVTSSKRANLDAILDHPATQWLGLPVAGAAVGAALHPLIMALERAKQHGQTSPAPAHGHAHERHPHYTRLHHSMLASADVSGHIALSRALQHMLHK